MARSCDAPATVDLTVDLLVAADCEARQLWALGSLVAELLLQRVDLAKAANVPHFVSEVGAQECVDTFAGGFGADDAGAQNEHVHVVVLDTLVGRVRVVTESGTNPTKLVGCNASPDAAATDQYAAFGLAVEDGAADLFGEVGIVDGGRGVGTDIENLVALLLETLDDELFQIEPCVVTTYDNKHE